MQIGPGRVAGMRELNAAEQEERDKRRRVVASHCRKRSVPSLTASGDTAQLRRCRCRLRWRPPLNQRRRSHASEFVTVPTE